MKDAQIASSASLSGTATILLDLNQTLRTQARVADSRRLRPTHMYQQRRRTWSAKPAQTQNLDRLSETRTQSFFIELETEISMLAGQRGRLRAPQRHSLWEIVRKLEGNASIADSCFENQATQPTSEGGLDGRAESHRVLPSEGPGETVVPGEYESGGPERKERPKTGSIPNNQAPQHGGSLSRGKPSRGGPVCKYPGR